MSRLVSLAHALGTVPTYRSLRFAVGTYRNHRSI